ncbi:MAG: FecR family protein [Opitutales bacterium]|nr:FecR family protein [Opitutales bacterium]
MRQLISIILGVSLFAPVSVLIGQTTSFDRATIREVINQVEIVDPETLSGSMAEEGALLQSPNILETGRRSRAELALGDDTVIRVGSNSAFSFPEEGRQLNLNEGSVLLHSPSGRGGGSIVTSSATASVVGTTFIVVATSDGGFKVMLMEGEGKVTFPNGVEQNLQPGQMMFVLPGSTGVTIDQDGGTGTVEVVAGEPGPVLDFDLERQSENALLLKGFSRGLPSWEEIQTEILDQLQRIGEGGLRRTNRLIIGAINREFVFTYETENRPIRSYNQRDRGELGGETIPIIEGDPFVLTPDHMFSLNPTLTLDGQLVGEGVVYQSAANGNFSSFAFSGNETSAFFDDRVDTFFNENDQEHAVFGFQSLFVDGFSVDPFADRGLALFSEGETIVHLGVLSEGSTFLDLPEELPSLAFVTEDGPLSVVDSEISAGFSGSLIDSSFLFAAGGPNGDLLFDEAFLGARDFNLVADQSLTILSSTFFAEAIDFFGGIDGPLFEGGGDIIEGPEIDQLIPLTIEIFSNAGPIVIQDSQLFASGFEYFSDFGGERQGEVLGTPMGEGEEDIPFIPIRPIVPSGAAPQHGRIVIFSNGGPVTVENTALLATGGQLTEFGEIGPVLLDSESGRIDMLGETLKLDSVQVLSQGDSGTMFFGIGREGITVENSGFLIETPTDWFFDEGETSGPAGVFAASGGSLYFGDSNFTVEPGLGGTLVFSSGGTTHLSNATVTTGADSGRVTVSAGSEGTVLIDGVGDGGASGGMTRITAEEIKMNGQIIGIRDGVLTGQKIELLAYPLDLPESEISTGADFDPTIIGTDTTSSISMEARTIILENTHLMSDGTAGSVSLGSNTGRLNIAETAGGIVVGKVNYVGENVRYTGGDLSNVQAIDATWAPLDEVGNEDLPIHIIQKNVD